MERPPVLIFALVYPPDNYTGAARPYRFSRYLQELGYQVDILAGSTLKEPSHSGNVHRFPSQMDEGVKDSFLEKIIRKFFLPADEGGIGWVLGTTNYARRWKGQSRVMLSTAPPFTVHLAAIRARKILGWKWIADFRDPLVGNRYRASVPWIDRWLEKAIFRNADALIANTENVANVWKERYPQYVQKIHTIYNGFDPQDQLRPAPIPQRQRKVLRHTGAVYGDRYPVILLESLRRLIQAGKLDPRSLLVDLVGILVAPPEGVPREEWFQGDGKQVSKPEADRLLAESDYLLLLDTTKSNQSLQIPAKMFEYVCIGRPILACTMRDSPVDRILTKSGIPYVGLYAGDAEAEIDRLLLGFLQLPTNPVEPSEWYRSQFDGREQAKVLAGIIESVREPVRESVR